MAGTGQLVYALYKLEGSTYKTTAETNYKNFGHNLKITSFEIDNAVSKQYGIGNYDAASQVAGAFSGKIGLEFILGDPWMFSALTGNIAVDAGGGPYTHTFINTAATPVALAAMKSMTIDLSYAFATAGHHTLSGCVIDSLSMKFAVDEPVVCTLEMSFASAAWSEAAATTRITPTDAPYTFAYANIEFPTSTTLTNVQSVDLTISRNGEIKRGLGSRTGAFYITKQSDYDIKCNLPFDIKTQLLYAYGGAATTAPAAIMTETGDMRIVLDNAAATTANRKLDMNFTGSLVNKFSTSASAEEMMTEDLAFSVRGVKSIIATDNVATQPV